MEEQIKQAEDERIKAELDETLKLHSFLVCVPGPLGGYRIWPEHKPLPTLEQWYAAERKMREEANARYEKGYQGDWGFTLSLTVSTYNRALWWHLFYPDEKLTLEEGMTKEQKILTAEMIKEWGKDPAVQAAVNKNGSGRFA